MSALTKLPSEETRKVLNWLRTEMTAGMVIFPRSEADQTWNDAHQRCLGILKHYEQGEGLFQMTEKLSEPPQPQPPLNSQLPTLN